MIAWRLTTRTYAGTAFDGEGARLYGGRWNSPGRPMTYAASSLALAALEQLVHLGRTDLLERQFVRFHIEVPDDAVATLDRAVLPDDGRHHLDVTRNLGDRWLASRDALALRVPSAVIPEEDNLLLNPLHEDVERLAIGAAHPFVFDPRLVWG